MRGSVRLKGKTWSYRIDLGEVDGKRKQIERSGYKTEKEALVALNAVLYEINTTGDYYENQKISFHDLFYKFLEEEAEATRAYNTILKYKSLFRNHLDPYFGPHYMYQINSNFITKFINEKSKTFSEEYVKGLHKLLNVLFDFAVRSRVLKKNPMMDVTPPPDPRHKGGIVVYTNEEIALMRKRISTTNLRLSFEMALNTGLRESECFALRWSDIDLQKGIANINKQLLFQNKRWCFAPLKTLKSYRSVELNDRLIEFLKKEIEKQEAQKVIYGDAYVNENFVFDVLEKNKVEKIAISDFINVKENGEMLTTNSVKYMARAFKELGIKFKYHNLRHTCASILAENGASPIYVQRLLGHSKMEFTMAYYTHVTDKMITNAQNSLMNIFWNDDNGMDISEENPSVLNNDC